MIRDLLPSLEIVLKMLGMTCISSAGLLYLIRDKTSLKVKIIREFFRNSKLYIKIDKDKKIEPKLLDHRQENDKQELFIYKIPSGLSLKDFVKKKEALEHQLKGEVEIWSKEDKLFIRLYYFNFPDRADFIKNKNLILDNIYKTKLGVSIGFSRRGYIVNDFSKATCHLLLGGETGSGKSVLLRQLIVSAILTYTHNELHFYFIDLKGGIEMIHFKDSSHTQKIGKNNQEAYDILQKLNNEVDNRLSWLKSKGVTSIYELKSSNKAKVILVIDELAELKDDDDCTELLQRLSRLARAVGIHIIAATQRPDSNTIDSATKANMPGTIAMKTKSEINSRILLDNNEAAYIEPVEGRGIYQLNQNIKIQVPYINIKDTKELINERNKELGYNPNLSPKSKKEAPEEIINQTDNWELIV